MRNNYGRNVYAKHVLPMKAGAKLDPGFNPEWSPSDGHSLAVGADLRAALLWVDTEWRVDPETDEAFKIPEILTGFLMQSDVYAAAELTRHVTLYADYGLASGSLEAFGLVKIPLADAYVKVGAFMPAYGLRIPNHRTYIREEGLGFEPNLRDMGIETGIFPKSVGIVVSAFNGGSGATALNPDFRFGISGRADVTYRSKPLKLTVGASWWWEPGGEVDFDGEDMTTLDRRLGGYVMASAWRLTFLGEVDHRRTEDAVSDTSTDILVGYGELDFLVTQGVDVNVLFEYYDPDTRLKPNALQRVGVGVELFPTPHTEIKVLGRHTFGNVDEAEDDPRTFFSAASVGTTELLVFLHVFM